MGRARVVDASPGVLVVYLTAPDAAVAVWGGPDGARAEVAADPQGGHLDVREGQLVGWGEVEVHAAEAVVLAVLGVLRQGLVVDELGEFAPHERVDGRWGINGRRNLGHGARFEIGRAHV